MSTPIQTSQMKEVFILVDDDGDLFLYREPTENEIHRSRMVIQLVYDVTSGFTTSRMLKNSLGGQG